MKEKINVDQQIEHMKSSGIQLNIVTEEEAKVYLQNNTYYFKLKSYNKLYDKNKDGKYINLEFAYLRELAVIDMHLRHLILKTTVDVEHSLKVQLIKDFNDSDSDGYEIIKKYFEYNENVKDKILQKRNPYCEDLITKLEQEGYALWNIIELLSFGDFIKLYKLFYEEYPDAQSGTIFTYPMYSVKNIRNAAAHNNCIVNQLKKTKNEEVNQNRKVVSYVSKIKNITKTQRQTCMQRQVMHDFVTLIYVVDKVIKSDGIKNNIKEELARFINVTAIRHKEYFEKHNELVTIYDFTKKIIDNMGMN